MNIYRIESLILKGKERGHVFYLIP